MSHTFERTTAFTRRVTGSSRIARLRALGLYLTQRGTARQVAFHYQAALNQGVRDDTSEINEAILSGLKRQRAIDMAREIVEAPVPAAPRRPSIQVSAPVSREAPAASGKREPPGWNTLSAEERDIARRSIIDRPDMPRITNEQKEWTYLQQRNKYRRMLADGSYSEQKG